MYLGLYTDSVVDLSFEEALDFAVRIGARGVEIAAGGQSSAPHMRVFELVEDAAKRARFAEDIRGRGLELTAINCSAWPVHPVASAKHVAIMEAAIELAGLLGVEKVVTMSGCPGEGPAGRHINWVWYPWPEELTALLERQWEETTALWRRFGAFAANRGVKRIALELHPLHLVYNVPTLLRLREAVGDIVGANVYPSHMFWQRMDAAGVVRTLGDAVFHVHLKDIEFAAPELALSGVLDNRGFEGPRAWIFRTVGDGHGASFWRSFLEALADIGYHDALCIEHEDPTLARREGVERAAAFVRPLIEQIPRERGTATDMRNR